jgi:hypothetical protein
MENGLRGNIFDLRKLHTLHMVSLSSLEQDKEYWVVNSKQGLAYTNWKTKVRVKHIINKNTIIAECTIMDGNYAFMNNYGMDDYTYFYV